MLPILLIHCSILHYEHIATIGHPMCGRWVSQPLDSVLIHFAMSIVVRCRLKWADEFDSSEQVFEARILKNTFKIWRICQWRILRVQLSTSITISVAGIVQIKASGIRIRGGLFLMGSIEREAILLYSCQWIWYYIFTSGKAAGVGWKSLKWVGVIKKHRWGKWLRLGQVRCGFSWRRKLGRQRTRGLNKIYLSDVAWIAIWKLTDSSC